MDDYIRDLDCPAKAYFKNIHSCIQTSYTQYPNISACLQKNAFLTIKQPYGSSIPVAGMIMKIAVGCPAETSDCGMLLVPLEMMSNIPKKFILYFVCLTCLLSVTGVTNVEASDTITSVFHLEGEAAASEAADSVSISTSSITWLTYNYSLTNDYLIASHDPNTIVSHTYTAYIIENNYLKLTIVPGFGGRLLSMYNKVTGHEELYQNPVGAPYMIGWGIFYYDWLMICGGIFPAFPEPEHGKTWLRAWSFQTVTNTADEVTIAMSYQDNDGPVRGGYTAGITNVTCTFYVTLKAGRTAVDTKIVLENAKSTEVTNFEYWTNTSLAPGSTPGDTRCTDSAEIVVPHEDTFQIVDGYGVGCGTDWDSCKWFVNHTSDGIKYASPNMKGRNFWGVINHDNDEGIFRVSDNSITQGIKIWTFGYDSVNVDPYAGGHMDEGNNQWKRPFLELWAGLTPQFWQDTTLAANSEIVITEVYSPSVGMQDVTHATDKVLANLTETTCQLYFMNPNDTYQVTLTRNDGATSVYSGSVTPDPANGHTIPVSGSGELELVITDGSGTVIFDDTSSGPPMYKGDCITTL